MEECEHRDCIEPKDGDSDYCQEHHEFHFCECGRSLGEYAGEGFCPSCR